MPTFLPVKKSRLFFGGLDFVEIGGLGIGDMEEEGVGIFIEGVAHGVIAALDSFIETAHMPVDGDSFLAGEADETADHIDGFFAVSVGERIFDGIEGAFFPLAVFVFDIAEIDLVVVGFANIVQKRDDRHAFRRDFFFPFALVLDVEVLNEAIIRFDAMFAESAFIRGMELRGRGGGEEIAFVFQPVEKLVRAFSGDILRKNADKLRFVIFYSVIHTFLLA